jgi:ribonuclease-3
VKSNGLENPDQLEEILQYRFRDQALLTQAMTHRSWAHEQVSPRAQRDARNLHNEALEFLGDSILGLIVADYLSSLPNATEGELSHEASTGERRPG